MRGQRDDDRGDRHRDRELAQRQVPVALQHLALDLEAVPEQDHDQRHGRQIRRRSPSSAPKSSTPVRAVARG